MGVSRSMTEFSGKLDRYITDSVEQQHVQLTRAERRLNVGLIAASRRAAGEDRRLSRVGRATGFEQRKGTFLGFLVRKNGEWTIEFKKTGAWQFRDSTVTAGPTDVHEIGPRPDRNRRPLPPGKKYQPTMREVGGGFLGQAKVWHWGSQREPFWGNAIERIEPVITKEFKKMWTDVPRKAFS